MKKGRIVRSTLVPDVFYFLSRWKQDGRAIEVIDERSRWDVSESCLALEKAAIRSTLRSLIVRAEHDGLDQSVIDWLKDRVIGPAGRWHVSHDTPTSEIEPPSEATA